MSEEQELAAQFSYMSVTDPSQSQINRFQSPAVKQVPVQKQRSSGYDEKPIVAKGSYAIPEPDEFDMQNLNFVDDLSEKQEAEADENLMAKVYGGI